MTSMVSQLPAASYSVSFDKAKLLALGDEETVESQDISFYGIDFKLQIRKERGTFDYQYQCRLLASSTNSSQCELKLYAKKWNPDISCELLSESDLSENQQTFGEGAEQGPINCRDIAEENSQYVQNGKVYFVVDIKVHIEPEEDGTSNLYEAVWKDDIANVLFDVSTSDLTIVVDEDHIPCHKVFLSLASPVFKAMFENQMQESILNEIVISDFSADVIRSFLKCIYNHSAVQEELQQHAQQLLLMSNKYEVIYLKNLATKHIILNLTVSNVLNVLQFAHAFHERGIKQASLKVMAQNAKVFMKQSDLPAVLGHDLAADFYCYLAENFNFEPNNTEGEDERVVPSKANVVDVDV